MLVSRLALIALILAGNALASEVIVRFDRPLNANNMPVGFSYVEPLIPALNVYLLRDNNKSSSVQDTYNKAIKTKNVKSAMPNQKVEMRSVMPNDPSFSAQWGMDKISAPLAWAIGKGGRNMHNDEIVVAVIDGGADIDHEDLVDNKWVNKFEISGNGIDDDGNGYIDDVDGWNAHNSTGVMPKNEHGTHVAGIIGAKGDNGKHVAGVNWNVKVMSIAGSSGNTAIVLRAYGFVYAHKKLWLDSKAHRGSNIVATNSSFGVDRGDCSSERFKLWNEIYDEMGKIGILSVVATANQAWDIDVVGDVPSACESPYIVAVTNTTKDDQLYSRAGWGKTQIDLAAPGTGVLSTTPNNGARSMTGTSMATPHVAGAIGLLQSIASSNFIVLSKEKPARSALVLKEILLSTVDKLPELADKTVSGGRLNLYRAAEAISRY